MNDAIARLLVSVLARSHAAFRPLRQVDWGRLEIPSAIYDRRRAFWEIGVRWSSGGAAADRKQAERLVASAVAEGAVTVSGKARTLHLRMTDMGLVTAEALAGVPSADSGHYFAKQLLGFAPAGRWVSELLPSELDDYDGTSGHNVELFASELMFLAARLRGWCESASDCHGRAAYRVTPAGVEIASQPEPTLPKGLPTSSRKLQELHDRELVRERGRIRASVPRTPGELGEIPIAMADVVGPWNYKNNIVPACQPAVSAGV